MEKKEKKRERGREEEEIARQKKSREAGVTRVCREKGACE